jgi:hypothetical protein
MKDLSAKGQAWFPRCQESDNTERGGKKIIGDTQGSRCNHGSLVYR